MQSAHAQILQQLTPAARARLVRADEEDLVRVGGRGGHSARRGFHRYEYKESSFDSSKTARSVVQLPPLGP